MNEKIDLHIHTSGSDGSDSVKTVIDRATKENLETIAITDHDSVDGICEYLKEYSKPPIEIISGVEITAQSEFKEMHLLGYFFDWDSDITRRLKEYKQQNIRKYINWLKTGSRCAEPFVPVRMSVDEILGSVKASQGIVVLAHPKRLQISDQDLEQLIRDLKNKGLDGIECFYPEHNMLEIKKYISLAKKYDLLITLGSDYHGKSKPDIKLGCCSKNEFFEEDILDKIKKKVIRKNV